MPRLRKQTDGLAVMDFSRVRCELHGVKLRECGCNLIWADQQWMHERILVRARRLGRLYARRREMAILAALFPEEGLGVLTGRKPETAEEVEDARCAK